MRFNEVQFPRKFQPREDFPSNRSSELENPNRAGEIYRAEIEFGKPKCNEVSVKSLLADPSVARVQRGATIRSKSCLGVYRSEIISCTLFIYSF